MKKMAYLLMIPFLISACSATKQEGISRADKRHQAKLAEISAVKQAVESMKYIIRMDRLYLLGGGFIDLVPRNNYIIVDRGAASISLGYVGRNFGRPISGINFNVRTTKYKLENNQAKGVYKVDMEVKFSNTKFDVYISIGSEGNCSVSVINSYIESVNYAGHLVPIKETATGGAEDINRL
jgi:hypothetical protein